MSTIRDIRNEIKELEKAKKIKDQQISTSDIAKIIQQVKDTTIGFSDRVNVSSFYGMKSKYELQRAVNPTVNYKEEFLLFDSNFKDLSRSDGVTFSWNVVNTQVKQIGTISTVVSLRNIVGMQLYPFTMTLATPIQSNEKTIINYNAMADYNYTIFIEEFKSQAIYGRDGRHYHFVVFPYISNPNYLQNLDEPITPANPYVEFVTSGKGNGWFWFQKPIIEFSTITINFGNPWDLISIPNTSRIILPIKFIYDYRDDTVKQ